MKNQKAKIAVLTKRSPLGPTNDPIGITKPED